MMMSEENTDPDLQQPELPKVESPMEVSEPHLDSKEIKSEKSSISVIFTDWVPAGQSGTPKSEENYNVPILTGRYFHKHGGHGAKIRPGLGTNPEDYAAKPKSKKRKKSAMELLQSAETINKRFMISPEKPATAILNEINPNLQYQYQELKLEGCKSVQCFTCSVVFPPESGTEFIGEGRSKKFAKNDAAEKVLASLGLVIPQKPDEPTLNPAPNVVVTTPELTFGPPPTLRPMHFPFRQQAAIATNDFDFSSDDIINVNFTNPAAAMLSQPMVDAGVFRRLRNIPNFEENICLALNTIVLPNTIECEYLGEEGPPHDKVFTVKLSCNMQEYAGKGGSKKKAKADAAKKAVIALLGEDSYRMMVKSSQQTSSPTQSDDFQNPTEQPKSKRAKKKKAKQISVLLPSDNNTPEGQMEYDEDEDDSDDWGEYDLNFSDHISNLVREKYEELMGKDATYSSYKVLAGVVLTTGSPMIYNSSVIAVTTGTKCIDGDFISEQGLSVNDSHAEILATRCVRDYLYSQIERLESAKSEKDKLENILEENPSPERQHKYQLKCDVKFHLFISTSPCGDARIFSPKGIELDEDQPSPTELEDTHPNKLNRGVLRSKIEAGEGTIPSANLYSGPQTWDSIVSGNALYTMSCSDKVCKWNVLGFQGALLYNFVGTVFYSSITLGSLHHPVHFKRAVYGRIEQLNSRLEIPFHVNKPKLMMVSREEKRRVKKSPNHAVCWSVDWSTPEILAANKGRCEGGVASRLTKRMAFNRFLKLYQNHSGRREEYIDKTYHEAKHIALDYQNAKKKFIDFFQDCKLGPWIGKPIEQDDFKIN